MRWRIITLVVTGVLAVSLGGASAYAWFAEDDEARHPTADETTVVHVEAGRQLFQVKGCAACHDIWAADMTAGYSTGPDLSRLAKEAVSRVEGMVADEYVRVSIAAPESYVLPGYGYFGPDGFFGGMPALSLTPAEIDALAEFLLSIEPSTE